MITHSRLAVAAALVGALELAACGKSSDSSAFVGTWAFEARPNVQLQISSDGGAFSMTNAFGSRVPLKLDSKGDTLTAELEGENSVLSYSAKSDTIQILSPKQTQRAGHETLVLHRVKK